MYSGPMAVYLVLYGVWLSALIQFGCAQSTDSEPLGWQNDWDFLGSAAYIGCDFRKYDKDATVLDTKQPFVTSGRINNWQAHQRWKKNAFLQNYGTKSIRVGSESSIVYAAGNAGMRISIQELVEQMAQNHTSKGDTPFVFDTTVLATIPAMRFDFSVPEIFSSWDHSENERSRAVWHMLSLGASRSGLPAHNHGQTWLGLVHGMKRWFIYPPGYGPPPEEEEHFNPLLSVTDWLETVYPRLERYPKPPLDGSRPQNTSTTGFRPLECIQMPGELMYLPAKWTHTTLNIGESIALGGQEKSYDNIEESLAMLARFPKNYELNKDMGLAQMNRAEILNNKFKDTFGYSERGQCLMLHDAGELFTHLVDTKDTWVVLYYHHGMYKDRGPDGESPTLRHLFFVMDTLAKRLHARANVALMDMTNQKVTGVYEGVPVAVDAATGREYVDFPFVKVHRGGLTNHSYSTPFVSDKKGVLFRGNLHDVADLFSFIDNGFRADKLSDGSVFSLTNSALQYYQSGVGYLIKSLKAKPFHPETHISVCNALSNMMLRAPLDQCISNAAALFDTFDVPGVSKIALSTVFQRLARIYMNKNLYAEALSLVQKSLFYNSRCPNSLVDQVIIYIELKDKQKAREALEQLKMISNDDRATREIPRLVNAVNNMT